MLGGAVPEGHTALKSLSEVSTAVQDNGNHKCASRLVGKKVTALILLLSKGSGRKNKNKKTIVETLKWGDLQCRRTHEGLGATRPAASQPG